MVNPKRETESHLIVAQNNVIRINYVKESIRWNRIASVDYVLTKTKLLITLQR